MKISVSEPTYNEISILLKRLEREINDGSPLTIEKGDAIMPPYDFRMVAVRQNCLIAAAEVYKTRENEDGFLKVAEEIFNWVLNGAENEKR